MVDPTSEPIDINQLIEIIEGKLRNTIALHDLHEILRLLKSGPDEIREMQIRIRQFEQARRDAERQREEAVGEQEKALMNLEQVKKDTEAQHRALQSRYSQERIKLAEEFETLRAKTKLDHESLILRLKEESERIRAEIAGLHKEKAEIEAAIAGLKARFE